MRERSCPITPGCAGAGDHVCTTSTPIAVVVDERARRLARYLAIPSARAASLYLARLG